MSDNIQANATGRSTPCSKRRCWRQILFALNIFLIQVPKAWRISENASFPKTLSDFFPKPNFFCVKTVLKTSGLYNEEYYKDSLTK